MSRFVAFWDAGTDSRRGGALASALIALIALVAAACGASPAVIPTPTHTPMPIHPGQGALYAFATNLGPTGPTSANIYALDLTSGQQVWHAQASGGGAGAALGGGTLYLGSYVPTGPNSPPTSTLQAYNASTGAPLWHVAPPSVEVLPVAANSDAVFAFMVSVASGQTVPTIALTALRASDGTSLWSADMGQAPGEQQGAIALGDTALYFVTMSQPSSGNSGPGASMLNAVDIGTGKSLWTVPLSGPVNAGPVLSGGVLYAAVQDTSDGSTKAILAIQASDGKTLWSKAPPAGSFVGGFTITGQTVCYSYGLSNGPGGGVVALHTADGSQSWQTSIQSGGPVPIASDSNAVYALESTKSAAPTLATTLNAFDARSGNALYSKPFPTLSAVQVEFGVGTPLQVSNGVLYVVGSGFSPSTATQQPAAVSIALAFNTHDGSVLWQHPFNGSAQPGFLLAP